MFRIMRNERFLRIALLLLAVMLLVIGVGALWRGKLYYDFFPGRGGLRGGGSPILAAVVGVSLLYVALFQWKKIKRKLPRGSSK